jgi:hypothetical protein
MDGYMDTWINGSIDCEWGDGWIDGPMEVGAWMNVYIDNLMNIH